MSTYKHMRTGRVITESEYRRLLSYEQREYSYNGSSSSTSNSSGDFLQKNFFVFNYFDLNNENICKHSQL
jgi:hypothetical protein